ncbi:GAP family protein [Microbacterium sp. Se63.02b]|uniref:GAP family protein n=1 Tax=Microbacterium sp. Se63.02b TaxID=2709304 RepID=UPI0016050F17|nr:GAP family protein [Microbacterium sp. Se63.02b]QNA92346.1 hypothetical protein G4G29_08110 [Microbacterium sp. Se63.02b]
MSSVPSRSWRSSRCCSPAAHERDRYLLGWLGLGGLLAFFLWLFPQLAIRERNEPPLWVPVVRLLIGAFLVCAAVWVYRKGHAHVEQMAAASSPRDVVAASPQLPGWLHSVESFRPGRTFLLGGGAVRTEPGGCVVRDPRGADISQSEVGGTAGTVVAIVFVVVGTLPVAAPVLYVIIRGADAQPALDRVRTWIAGNSHVLNAALLLVIGALQLEKAIAALL